MNRPALVLSLFPGLDLFGKAFHQLGYCVVQGPELLTGGRVEDFHPPFGCFDGVIGGPPCQAFSRMRHILRNQQQPRSNLIPEFERVTGEAGPSWFVMENVTGAPAAVVAGYTVTDAVVSDFHVGGLTRRTRRFSFGLRGAHSWPRLYFDFSPLTIQDPRPAVLAQASRWERLPGRPKGKRGRNKRSTTRATVRESAELQGLASTFFDEIDAYSGRPVYTQDGRQLLLGNAVPLALGRAIAAAVARLFPPHSEGT